MEKILILDFAGNTAQTVARRVRELKVYSEILPNNTSSVAIAAGVYKGIIQIGGSGNNPPDVPVLDYDNQSESSLREFLFDTCKCEGTWRIQKFVEDSINSLKEKIGNKTVLLALSGGVDSSVVALMLHKAIGPQLRCIFVDHGLLRKFEAAEVMELFGQKHQMNVQMVDASERFLQKLAGITDPEQKRKIIGEEFIRVFEDEAKKIGKVDFLAQGTIYPDIIESGVGGELVKSHHNVGGLPDCVEFDEIIEPLRDLFKDEVRMAGLALGMPENLVWRQPFPGPGLGVRVLGELTRERLDLLRDADYIFRSEVMKAGLHREVGQYFAVLTDIYSVGVKDDKRTYQPTVALRAVNTKDFMTAKFCRLPYDLLELVSRRITDETAVGRVVYDVTGKPPGTIEWE